MIICKIEYENGTIRLGQEVKLKGRNMKGTIKSIPYPDDYWGVTLVVRWSPGAESEHCIEEIELL